MSPELLTLVVLPVAGVLILGVPGMAWGWWSAIGGEGNPVLAQSSSAESLGVSVVLVPVFLALLVVSLPLLVESEELWDEVRRGFAAESGLPWPPDATRAMQGMSTEEWSAYLTDVVGMPGESDDVAAEVIDRMAARYREGLPLLPGARDVVRRLGARWPLGLASSSPRRLIDAVLESAGLADQFLVTVSTEEVAAGKPSPEVYLHVVRKLGVSPEHAVAIEDSSNGIRSAAEAGLRLIAVPNAAYPPADDALALADAVVRSLDDIDPQLVTSVGRERWGRHPVS